MNTETRSLRMLVERWLAPSTATPLRVTRFGRTANGVRFVEVHRPSNALTIAFFFHHENGDWCVFPPRTGPRRNRRARVPGVAPITLHRTV
nr:hypothetical protein [Paraburkholderia fynbosensis]